MRVYDFQADVQRLHRMELAWRLSGFAIFPFVFSSGACFWDRLREKKLFAFRCLPTSRHLRFRCRWSLLGSCVLIVGWEKSPSDSLLWVGSSELLCLFSIDGIGVFG